jgi:hypothetical protein
MSDTTPHPELQVLKHLQATCTIIRRTPDTALAKAVLAEEERLVKRIERLMAATASVDASTEEVPV